MTDVTKEKLDIAIREKIDSVIKEDILGTNKIIKFTDVIHKAILKDFGLGISYGSPNIENIEVFYNFLQACPNFILLRDKFEDCIAKQVNDACTSAKTEEFLQKKISDTIDSAIGKTLLSIRESVETKIKKFYEANLETIINERIKEIINPKN